MKTAYGRVDRRTGGGEHDRWRLPAIPWARRLPLALVLVWLMPNPSIAGEATMATADAATTATADAATTAPADAATTPAAAATTPTVSRPPVLLMNQSVLVSFQILPDGIELANLTDLEARRQVLAGGQPFWRVVVEDAKGRRHEMDNRSGWRQVSAIGGGAWTSLTWRGPKALEAGTFEVRCDVVLERSQTTWQFAVENDTSATVRNVVFPHVVTRPLGGSGGDDTVVYPAASGRLHDRPFRDPLRYSGDYPSGWCSYQFLLHHDFAGGVYVATYDPVASTKRIEARTLDDKKGLRLAFDWPAPDATIAGNDFEMTGPAVIRMVRGDWFDAAQLYKMWVRKEAQWWPDDRGRKDTPPWMHEIAIWAQTGGTSQSVVGPVREFAQYMGVPTALHWYNWHAIPFDDDYPHYFPAKPGFREGVRALQDAGVRVMPYINGRLWDTDLEDFATTAHAAATKNEKGEPYTEQYGSGQKLAAMCPATQLWQDKVTEIVLRLLGPDYGVDGVYIDQVAAARPRLCFDRSHGHPLGGGFWWTTRGYWPLLERLQAAMKNRDPEKMITTECNAEPYIHLFDGYLTWHFQYQGQVPVFAAIYGGQIQLFGRAYRGGPSKDLALRMKAAQSLVFGEQIGWCSPGVIHHKDNGPFMRRMARLRHALRDYLADGQMLRPPDIAGEIPDVTADWRWRDEWPITDLAVQRGAWRARDGRIALIFANVTSTTMAFDLNVDGTAYGFEEGPLRVTPRDENGIGRPKTQPVRFRRPVGLGPFEAIAYEIEAVR